MRLFAEILHRLFKMMALRLYGLVSLGECAREVRHLRSQGFEF